MKTLDEQILHIATSVAGSGHYATYEGVLRNLLGWHGVPEFSLLPIELRLGGLIAGPLDCALLRHLYDLELRLHTFVAAAVSTRDIATFRDVETDATMMCRSFLVPHLKDLACGFAAIPAPNPEEIDIDASCDEPGVEARPVERGVSFEKAFGVGPLRRHPTVEAYFGPATDGERPQSESAVLQHLLEYLSAEERSDNATGDVSLTSFAAHVARKESVSTLVELGVILRPAMFGPTGEPRGLGAECQALRHVVLARARRQADIVAAMMRDADTCPAPRRKAPANHPSEAFSSGEVTADGSSGSQRVFKCTLSLRRPARPSLATFVDACKASLGDSSYSPSFSRMQQVVSSLVLQEASANKKSSKKRKGASLGHDATSVSGGPQQVILDVATEYAMLHFGGSKYRSRAVRFGQTGDGDREDGQGGFAEEEDHGSDQPNSDAGISSLTEVSHAHIESIETIKTSAAVGVKEIKETDESSSTSSSSSSDDDSSQPAAAERAQSPKVAEKAAAPSTSRQCLPVDGAGASKESEPMPANGPLPCWEVIVQPPPAARGPGDDVGQLRGSAPIGGGAAGVIPGLSAAAAGPGGWARLPWGLPLLDRRDGRAVGRWGEAFVHQLLLQRFPPWSGARVEWVNEAEETRAAYDLKVTFPFQRRAEAENGDSMQSERLDAEMPGGRGRRGGTIFVEVKTTASLDRGTFDLSLQEWDFATSAIGGGGGTRPGCRSGSSLVAYHVYRVFGAGDPWSVRVSVIEDIVAAIEAKRVRLCLAIE